MNERPTWCHLLFYFTYYALNMFRTLIYPSSGACDSIDELPHRSSCSHFVVCWSFWCGRFLVVFVLQAEACKTNTTKSCPETSARHHHYSPRNNPEERSSQLQHLFQTTTIHFTQSLCFVLPCYITVVRYNSRTTLHSPNATLHNPCLCFPPNHLLFYIYSLYVRQRIMT